MNASPQVLRVVIGARLSQDTDRSTSVERQLEKGRAWATLKGGVVVGEAVDVDVSGSVDPWERDGLGPWLRRPQDFDALVYMKIDRMSRSTRDFANLLLWAEENDITIVAIDDGVDLSTDIGQMVAKILSIFSEFELRTIKKRIADSIRHLKAKGKWFGGRLPYWCERKTVNGLPVNNPERVEITKKMIALVMDDENPLSLSGVRDWLTKEGHLPLKTIIEKEQGQKMGEVVKFKTKKATGKRTRKRGKVEWETASVARILRSPALKGEITHKGKTLRDENGEPFIAYEPILTSAEWTKLQLRLDKLSSRYAQSTKARNVSNLKGVSFCWDCGLSYNLHAPKGRTPAYRCASNKRSKTRTCVSKAVSQELLEDILSDSIMVRLGHLPRMEKVESSSGDLSNQIEDTRKYLKEVRDEKDDGLYDYPGGEEEYKDRVKNLSDRLKDLLTQQEESAHGPTAVPIGGTFGDWWTEASWSERRVWLVDHGVKIFVRRHAPDHSSVSLGAQTVIEWGDLEELEKAARGLTSTNT